MATFPHIVVIVPAFNAERYLEETIQSVLGQSFPDWTLILVNDGSTDRTAAISERLAAADPRVRVITRPNGGLGAARNTGLMETKSAEAVLFLDADDLLEPEALARLMAALQANPSAPAAHGRSRIIDSDGHPAGPGFNRDLFRGGKLEVAPDSSPTTFEMLAAQNPIMSAGCVLIRRTVIAEVGTFNETFSGVADWDFWLRLAEICPLAFVPQTTLAYRRHSTSMSANKGRMRRDAARMRQAWLAHARPPERRLLIDGYTSLCRHYARSQARHIWAMLKARQWRAICQEGTKTAWITAKALPLVPRLAMTMGARF